MTELVKKSTIYETNTCSECGSLIFYVEGYLTCSNCGLVINELNFQAPIPHNKNQMGIQKKKQNLINFKDWERMNKIQRRCNNKINSLNNIKNFISDIFGQLQITKGNFKEEILNKYKEIKPKAPDGVKSYKYLIPILIKCYCKVKCIIISEDHLITIAGLDKNKFIKKLKKIISSGLLTDYKDYKLKPKSQKNYILHLLRTFIQYFFQNDLEIREQFLKYSKMVLGLLWDDLKCVNNENNKAGIVGMLILYYLEEKYQKNFGNLNKHKLCGFLDAKDSTVSAQIKNWVKSQTGEEIRPVKDKKKVVSLISQKIAKLEKKTKIPLFSHLQLYI